MLGPRRISPATAGFGAGVQHRLAMTGSWTLPTAVQVRPNSACAPRVVRCGRARCCSRAAAGPARSRTAPPPAPQSSPAGAARSAPALAKPRTSCRRRQPRFLDAIGRCWIGESKSRHRRPAKGHGTDAAKDAAGERPAGGTRRDPRALPSHDVVVNGKRALRSQRAERRAGLRGRERGAVPAKGFPRGASLDITSAHRCPASCWREGRAAERAASAGTSPSFPGGLPVGLSPARA